MTELKQLTKEQLTDLYFQVVQKRKEILSLVEKYGYNANQLVSRTFEHDIETLFGRLVLENNIPFSEDCE